MDVLRRAEGRRVIGGALCFAAMLGAEAARAGSDASQSGRGDLGGLIEVAYAATAPAPFLDSIQHAARRSIAARAAVAPAPRPTLTFGAPAVPDEGFDRVLYGATEVRRTEVRRTEGARADEDFMEGFETGAGMRWDPAAVARAQDGRFIAGWGPPAAQPRRIDVDDDPGDQLADMLGITGQVGDNAKLKLRYSNSRKRMKGLSLVFAYDF